MICEKTKMKRELENQIINADCMIFLKDFCPDVVDLIISDIPYGISYEEWDVIHHNTNSALLGTSPAQMLAGTVFKKRGKPLNGWSEADRNIPIEYYNWCKQWAADWLKILKPGASAFVFAGRRFAHRCICALEDSGFLFKDMIAWNKETAPHRAQRISLIYNRRNDDFNSQKWNGWRVGNLRPIFEPILWFMKPYKLGGTLADNVAEYNVGAINDSRWNDYANNSENIISMRCLPSDSGLHPTQKPLELMKALIELTTTENQIVCDPFCGSGTTLLAAKQLNRRYLGIEINKEYYEIAKKRLEDSDNPRRLQKKKQISFYD